MKTFDDFTDDELKNELERRKQTKKEHEIPKLIENPDLTVMKKALTHYINYIVENGHEEKDCEYWIYETAVKTFFGDNTFDWINKNIT